MRIETLVPWTLVKRGVRREVMTPIETPAAFREEAQRETQQRTQETHSPLLRALGLAHYWQELLDEGRVRSITEIAAAEGMDVGRMSRIVRLTQIPPSLVTACITDSPARLSLETFFGRVSLTWNDLHTKMPDRSP